MRFEEAKPQKYGFPSKPGRISNLLTGNLTPSGKRLLGLIALTTALSVLMGHLLFLVMGAVSACLMVASLLLQFFGGRGRRRAAWGVRFDHAGTPLPAMPQDSPPLGSAFSATVICVHTGTNHAEAEDVGGGTDVKGSSHEKRARHRSGFEAYLMGSPPEALNLKRPHRLPSHYAGDALRITTPIILQRQNQVTDRGTGTEKPPILLRPVWKPMPVKIFEVPRDEGSKTNPASPEPDGASFKRWLHARLPGRRPFFLQGMRQSETPVVNVGTGGLEGDSEKGHKMGLSLDLWLQRVHPDPHADTAHPNVVIQSFVASGTDPLGLFWVEPSSSDDPCT